MSVTPAFPHMFRRHSARDAETMRKGSGRIAEGLRTTCGMAPHIGPAGVPPSRAVLVSKPPRNAFWGYKDCAIPNGTVAAFPSSTGRPPLCSQRYGGVTRNRCVTVGRRHCANHAFALDGFREATGNDWGSTAVFPEDSRPRWIEQQSTRQRASRSRQ